MTDEWDLLFKCRLCGKIIKRGTLFGDIIQNDHMFDEHKIIHHCGYNRVGICDLVGYEGNEAELYSDIGE